MSKRLAVCVATFLIVTACNKSDQERARQRTDEAASKAKADLHRLGQDIKQEAKDANAELQKGMNGTGTNSAAEARAKVDHAAADAQAAAEQAGRKIDRATLVARVKARLAADAGLAAMSNVGVDANGSVVTLHGTVDTSDQKRMAVEAASRVDGVTQVRDEITVAH